MTTEPQDRIRNMVRLLGNLLGETIIEQEGQAVFELEEEFRALAKSWRAGDRSVQTRIEQMLPELLEDMPQAFAVLKAFTTYFQLINLAEEKERGRRREGPRPVAAGLVGSHEPRTGNW